MVFSSITFLCAFLPIVFLLHTVIGSIRVRNILLLVASLVFYAYGEPYYIFLLLICVLINYCFALGFASDKLKVKKALLVICVVLNLGILITFKYSDMIVQTINSLFSLNIPLPQIKLPIGISFFTFQAMSYSIDAYRNKFEIQKNPFKLLLYVSFFPQLIAGPIVKYKDVYNEIDSRTVSFQAISNGMVRFSAGLAKKVLLSNTLAVCADAVFSAKADQINIITAWIGAVCYMLQLLYDFSGYSDMAIGLGKMFGFNFKENFDHPYLSLNISEFWRRWHISLSTWFKEYLYIPLGGNRKGKFRTAFNKFVVFFCTGLWHGASWNFVVWGIYHGFFVILETYAPKLKKLPKAIAHLYTLIVVMIGFVIFRADTLGGAASVVKNMFFGMKMNSASLSLAAQQATPWTIFIFICSVVALFDYSSLKEKLLDKLNAGIYQAMRFSSALFLLVFSILRISSGAYNPFIYFRF